MAVQGSDGNDLKHSLSSAVCEVSDGRKAFLDAQEQLSSTRCNPFNSFKQRADSPTMEEGMQSYPDQRYFAVRSRRHCHKTSDNTTNSIVRRQLIGVSILCLIFMAIEATEIVGAFFSIIFIWVVSGVLCYIAAGRIFYGHYSEVNPDEMLITAGIGLLFSIVMAISLHSEACCSGIHSHRHTYPDLFEKDSLNQENADSKMARFDVENGAHKTPAIDKEEDKATKKTKQPKKPRNINVRAAFIHVIGDTIQSLGVLLSAVLIKFAPSEEYKLADPICTFVFSLVVLITTMAILRDVIIIFMEGVPRGTTFASVKKDLEAVDGVVTVHSLHIWALTMDETAVSVHLVIEHLHLHDQVLMSATRLLQDKHLVHFTTIQVELFTDEMNACADCLQFNE